MIEIRLYTPQLQDSWNKFVAECKNATFLHNRGYMDYHSNRFTDCSLVAYSKEQIIAVLPANRVDSTLYSHQGLTFGGWLIRSKHFNIINMLELFDEMKSFLPSIGIKELIYKAVPHIYHSYPAEEDIYAIFRNNGVLTECNISTTIEQLKPLQFNSNYNRSVSLALKNEITTSESSDYESYWKMLTERLNSRYKANPVHTLDEIKLLHNRFPENIRLFTAKKDNENLAGVVIYDTGIVAHAQYIASTDLGRKIGALPLLFKYLIEDVFKKRKYFDFGISNENHGVFLNEGLVMQKCHMGGRATVHNIYKLVF